MPLSTGPRISNTPDDSADIHWMNVAIEQALLGRGYVEPNPMSGMRSDSQRRGWSHEGTINFSADHMQSESPLPESLDISDATVYVTLEPCSHFVKRSMCSVLVAKRPRRVVVAMQDPYAEVSGPEVCSFLMDSGIDVTVGVCEAQARELNALILRESIQNDHGRSPSGPCRSMSHCDLVRRF